MAEPKRKATYDDVLAAPEHQVAEIVDGERGDPPRPGGWFLLDQPELHFADDVVVPDVAGWRRERRPLDAEAAWFTTAPDWLCETLSPSTEQIDVDVHTGNDRPRAEPFDAIELELARLWLD